MKVKTSEIYSHFVLKKQIVKVDLSKDKIIIKALGKVVADDVLKLILLCFRENKS